MSQFRPDDARHTSTTIDRGVLLAGTAAASFASLLLELALTRLFSVVLYYHFAFLVISLAMLGLGAGGVFAYVGRNYLVRWELRRLAGTVCACNAAADLAALWITLHTRALLVLSSGNLVRLTTIYVAAGIPFFLTGLLFSVVFARESRHVTTLYGADLMGGSLACIAVVPLLNFLGGPNAVVCAAAAMVVAAGIWTDGEKQRRISIWAFLFLVGLIAANHSEKLIDVTYAKGIPVAMPSNEFSQWNAISRIQVDHERGGKWINIDADAATPISHAEPSDVASITVTNLLRPRGDYAIIGPGGGPDVLAAVAAGSPNVTGIEINSIIVDTLMRGRYADYSHHLYELPQVHIHVSEGRSWLRSSQERYDVIQMTLVDTWASTSAGALALSENNLYTSEAFREYFDHLKPDGLLAITRWEFKQPREALRVVSQAIDTLRGMGVEDVRKNLMVIANGQPSDRGTMVTVLAKKVPFTIAEEQTVLEQVQGNPVLYPIYTPNVYGRSDAPVFCSGAPLSREAANCMDAVFARLATERNTSAETSGPFQTLINLPWHATVNGKESHPREDFIRNYPFNIAAVTDNDPFFFFTFKLTSVLRTLVGIGGQSSIDWKNNVGVAVIGLILAISVVAVLAFLIGPLVLERGAERPPAAPLLYFVAVGLGYILVEMALIQRFVLFMGHPTYAMTVVVFLMLLSGGAGSVTSKQWLSETRRVRFVLGAVVGILALYVVFLHRILSSLVALAFVGKLGVSAALLVPLGFLMGMPFPTGLRESAADCSNDSLAGNNIEWAWAVNVGSSVLGSVLAIVVALHFGLDVTLGCAAGTYLAAAILTLLWKRPAVQQSYVNEKVTHALSQV